MNDSAKPYGMKLRHRLIGWAAIGLILGLLIQNVTGDFLHFKALAAWSMITGYLALVLIALTLVIGPLKQWLPAVWHPDHLPCGDLRDFGQRLPPPAGGSPLDCRTGPAHPLGRVYHGTVAPKAAIKPFSGAGSCAQTMDKQKQPVCL